MAEKRITDVDFVDSLDNNESFFVNQNNTLKQINKNNITFGIQNGGTGATTAEEARINLGAITVFNTTVELASDGWSDNKQIVGVNNVSVNNMVIVTPDSATDNYTTYNECGIRCIEQAEGVLAFICEEVPNAIITVNIAVFL